MPSKYSYTITSSGKPFFYEMKAGKKVRIPAANAPKKLQAEAAKEKKPRKQVERKVVKSKASAHNVNVTVCGNMRAQLKYLAEDLKKRDTSDVKLGTSGKNTCLRYKTTAKQSQPSMRMIKQRINQFGVKTQTAHDNFGYFISFSRSK